MSDVLTRPSGADLVEKRRPLTRREALQLSFDQEGKCGCGCGVKLNAMVEGVIDEHVIPLELTGSNDLRNRALYRKPCADAKNKVDWTNIAKAMRRAGETCAGPAKHPIPKRPFPTNKTKRFDGTVCDRKPRRSFSTQGGE